MPFEAMVLIPLVIIAYTTEAMAGFGAALVAVTLGAHFIPIDRLVPILIPLNLLIPGYITLRYRKDVLAGLLFKTILPAMITGVIIGTLIYPYITNEIAKLILGILVVIFAGRSLYLHKFGQTVLKPFSKSITFVLQTVAGMVQAVYGSGGPVLIYTITRLNLTKKVFRATMCSVWLSINSVLVVVYAYNDRYDSTYIPVWAYLVPLIPISIFVGEKLHGLINEEGFKLLIHLMLLASGLILTIRSIGG